jgi:aspartate kinase
VWDPWAHRDPAHAVTGVTQLSDLIQFRVWPPASGPDNWSYPLFHLLGKRGVSVDLINLFPDQVYFCVKSPERSTVEATLADLAYPFEVYDNRAKVSIVGSAIEGLPGVVGHVMEALARENIRVLQSSDSHATITLLLDKKDMEAAVRALHQQFGLHEDLAPK